MAIDQLKKIGIIASLVSLSIVVVGIAWGGGVKITSVEKDVDGVRSNAIEDRQAIQAIAKRTTALESESTEAKLRDARQATQYAKILAGLENEATKTSAMFTIIKEMDKKVDEQTTINAVNSEKLQFLIKE